MSESSLPLVLIEGVLILGGALLFGWWQLRSVKRDQAIWAERERAQALAKQAAQSQATAEQATAHPPGDQPADNRSPPSS
jgi:hypothetical protein